MDTTLTDDHELRRALEGNLANRRRDSATLDANLRGCPGPQLQIRDELASARHQIVSETKFTGPGRTGQGGDGVHQSQSGTKRRRVGGCPLDGRHHFFPQIHGADHRLATEPGKRNLVVDIGPDRALGIVQHLGGDGTEQHAAKRPVPVGGSGRCGRAG